MIDDAAAVSHHEELTLLPLVLPALGAAVTWVVAVLATRKETK